MSSITVTQDNGKVITFKVGDVISLPGYENSIILYIDMIEGEIWTSFCAEKYPLFFGGIGCPYLMVGYLTDPTVEVVL